MTPVRLDPAASRSRVKHSTTEPLRSLWKESNILINYNNCFHILKRPLNLDPIEPLCYIFVKSDLQGYTLFICIFLPIRKMKVLIIILHSHYKWTLAL